MNAVYRSILAGLVAGVVTLAGCGGGGGGTTLAGIGGSGKTISGTITGFGSIFVNGVEYDINNAFFDINGDNSPGLNQTDLRVGMVVTLIGNDDGTVGVASQVTYNGDIKGPVSNLASSLSGTTKSFKVFDVTVVVDVANTTFDNSSMPGFDFTSLSNNDIVELSGLFKSPNTLIASYIEKTGDLASSNNAVEIKGTPAMGTSAGVGGNFMMNGVKVNILASTNLGGMPGNLVTDAQFIKVKGTLISASPAIIDAIRIEPDNEGIGSDDGEASIEGFISSLVNNDISSFKVSGQQVDATGATFVPAGLTLSNNQRVEVEGTLVNGILIATEVTLDN